MNRFFGSSCFQVVSNLNVLCVYLLALICDCILKVIEILQNFVLLLIFIIPGKPYKGISKNTANQIYIGVEKAHIFLCYLVNDSMPIYLSYCL